MLPNTKREAKYGLIVLGYILLWHKICLWHTLSKERQKNEETSSKTTSGSLLKFGSCHSPAVIQMDHVRNVWAADSPCTAQMTQREAK